MIKVPTLLTLLSASKEKLLVPKINRLAPLLPLNQRLLHSFAELITTLSRSSQPYSLILLDPFREDIDQPELSERIQNYNDENDCHIILVGSVDELKSQTWLFPFSAHISGQAELYQMAYVFNRLLVPEGSERREHPRAPVSILVEHTANFTAFEPLGEAISISSGGMFIRTTKPLAPDHLIHLRIALQSKQNETETIECTARVVYTRQQDPNLEDIYPTGMGVCFKGINEVDRMKIGEFIRPHLPEVDR